jgi:hypothetical protein
MLSAILGAKVRGWRRPANLADRVTRKDGNSKRRNGGSAEHPLDASIFSGKQSVG